MCGLSLVVASGSFFSCSVRASHYDGFSCCRVQSPGMGASVLVYTGLVAPQHLYTGLVAPQHVYTGLVAPQHVESSQTRDQTLVTYTDRQIRSRRTTREVFLLCLSIAFIFRIKYRKQKVLRIIVCNFYFLIN